MLRPTSSATMVSARLAILSLYELSASGTLRVCSLTGAGVRALTIFLDAFGASATVIDGTGRAAFGAAPPGRRWSRTERGTPWNYDMLEMKLEV